MGLMDLRDVSEVAGLVRVAQEADEAIIVMDGGEECLVVMRPTVFERILFDTATLTCAHRESLHF